MKNPPKTKVPQSGLTCIEICSGAGGQAIGLERAGFDALVPVDFDRHACETLSLNRSDWNEVEGDVRDFSAKEFKGEWLTLFCHNHRFAWQTGVSHSQFSFSAQT